MVTVSGIVSLLLSRASFRKDVAIRALFVGKPGLVFLVNKRLHLHVTQRVDVNKFFKFTYFRSRFISGGR